MSVEALALVLHHSRAKGTQKLVLIGIANHQGDGGAWPTVATLARYANVSERAVQQALSQLVRLRELAVHHQQGGTHNLHPAARPNRYDVLISCPPGCDRTSNHRVKTTEPALAELPLDPVNPASPGEAGFTPLVKEASPAPVKEASPKPSTEPADNPGVSLCPPTDRARAIRPAVPAPAGVVDGIRETLRVGHAD